MKFRSAAISVVVATAICAMPLSSASAHEHWRGHGPGLLFGLAAVGAAAVVGVATIVTAPVRALAAVPAYAPPPPVYAAPPPAYYAPPPAYYAPAPVVYAAPPGYYVMAPR
jgi:hypothetical protein